MQPGTNSEDIHTILGRFNQWTGQHNGNGNGHRQGTASLGEGAREISYEEAMRLAGERKGRGTGSGAAAAQAATATAAKAGAAAALAVASAAAEEKSLPPAKHARKVAKPKVQAAPAAKAARKPAREAKTGARKAAAPEFRQVLVKQVRKKNPAKMKDSGRERRVSVRLSRAEERAVQNLAEKAGVTVSEYLRRQALEAAVAQPEPEAPVKAAGRRESVEQKTVSEAARPAKSGLGDWIALLRNRFLGSPVRFAERA
jgi:hypothetical protein